MPWENARKFLMAELSSGATVPVEYTLHFKSGKRAGQTFKVIVLSPRRVTTLKEVRAKTGMADRGEQTISFAPTGTCPCCGR